MKPHLRIRKTIKWGGAAVTLLLVVVWIGSGWVWFQSSLGRWSFNVGRGFFSIAYFADFPPQYRCSAGANDHAEFIWKPSHCETAAILPLWMAVVPALLVTLAAGRLDTLARRRARPNLCPKCNYDRAGIAKDAVCPECGSAGEA
jgi:hypothetical protein